MKGLLCHETFAGADCSLEVYNFEDFEYTSELEYSGTARFEITLRNTATDINKLKDEYRKVSMNFLCLFFYTGTFIFYEPKQRIMDNRRTAGKSEQI